MTRKAAHIASISAWFSAIVLVSALSVLFGMIGMLGTSTAWADESIDTDPTPDELQLEVERSAAALEEARAAADAAAADAEKNSERIAELELLIPIQQQRSAAAAREQYKFEQQTLGIIELLLGSEDFFDFLRNLEYVDRVSRTNAEEMQRLLDMQSELAEAQVAYEKEREQAEARAAEAERALVAAQEARAEAQRKAEEEARRQAEEAAIAAAAARAAEGRAAQNGGNVDAGGSGGTIASVSEASDTAAEMVSDGADWGSDEEEFVSQWAARIDAYLAGSPLAGYGRDFAQAAWTYGVDPRWSPAISYVESSRGLYCFRDHNAWGWGSVDWDSWEEAIDAHVRGLARGYGYTISIEAAKKYCPPNYQFWYDNTLAQMNMI